MLQLQDFPFMGNWKLRRIAKQVRAGIVPKGVDKETVFEALRLTVPKNGTEIFGFLSALVERPGEDVEDLGLVSVKKVTAAFCNQVVDAMIGSSTVINDFNQHKMGSGSAAAASGDSALGAAMSGAQAATGGAAATHGATSLIYRSIGTVTATYNSEVEEHGLFNRSTGGVLLDRSVVTAISVNTDDVITWTYELSVNTST